MNTNRLIRRGFLALALTATVTFAQAPLLLAGDGRSDDAQALQALIDGKTVKRPDASTIGRAEGGRISLPTGVYFLGSDVILPKGSIVVVQKPWSIDGTK